VISIHVGKIEVDVGIFGVDVGIIEVDVVKATFGVCIRHGRYQFRHHPIVCFPMKVE
jgi:hypothetical protein